MDPIYVDACQYGGAYPNCNPPPDVEDDDDGCSIIPVDPACGGDDDSDACEYYGDCDPPGGGSDGEWSGDAETAVDDEVHSCHSLTSGACILTEPDSLQKDRIRQQLERIRSSAHPFCADLQARGYDYLDRPPIAPGPGELPGSTSGFKIWEAQLTYTDAGGTKTLYGDAHRVVTDNSPTFPEFTYEVHLWAGSINAPTIVHELLHTYGYNHDANMNPGGASMQSWISTCVG